MPFLLSLGEESTQWGPRIGSHWSGQGAAACWFCSAFPAPQDPPFLLPSGRAPCPWLGPQEEEVGGSFAVPVTDLRRRDMIL